MTSNIIPVVDITSESDKEEVTKLSEVYWKDYLEDKNYNKDISKMCEECIEEQIAKHGKQTIICTGSLDINAIDPNVRQELSQMYDEDSFNELMSLTNAYDFFEYNCDVKNKGNEQRVFKGRWYQEFLMKCVHEDTLVLMADGSSKKIKDIEVGDKVLSYNETRRSLPSNKVLNKWNSGVKPVYKITLENDDTIEVTDNHQILSHYKDGKLNIKHNCPSYKLAYKSIKEGLSVGMDVYTLNNNHRWGTYSNTEVAKLLGYLVTDGYIDLKSSKIQFSNIRKEYVTEFMNIVRKEFDCSIRYTETLPYTDMKGINRKHTYNAYVTKASKLKEFLKSINCINKLTKENSILSFVQNNFNEECVKLFINRAYSGDGCVYNSKTGHSNITFAGKISNFIPEWRNLLRKIGIWSPRVYTKNGGMVCSFTRSDDIIRFFNFVGLIYGKEVQSQVSLTNAQSRTKRVKKSGRFNTTTRTKIKTIEYVGEKQVYDIEVENRHNFIANNIVVHNCSARSKVVRMGRRCRKNYEFSN